MEFSAFWEKLEHGGRAAFASQLGMTAEYLRQIAGGHKAPSAKLAKQIERATFGQVRAETLRPDVFGELDQVGTSAGAV